jgi:hypothetical protein
MRFRRRDKPGETGNPFPPQGGPKWTDIEGERDHHAKDTTLACGETLPAQGYPILEKAARDGRERPATSFGLPVQFT